MKDNLSKGPLARLTFFRFEAVMIFGASKVDVPVMAGANTDIRIYLFL